MEPDLKTLYAQMLRSRLFEEAVAELWQQGLISGEMHLGSGEEAVVAGVVAHLVEGDALALDHRGTPPLLMRGLDPVLLLREFLGRPDGLCGGRGGHMHLFSRPHLAASSGIVGASGPAAAGLALAASYLRPGTLAVAFFGEGAMNQGMMLEALNLAAVWQLPAFFVCKDNDWAITTDSATTAGGPLLDRARSLGLAAAEVDGGDVLAVWQAAGEALARVRAGEGPAFLLACCLHLEGHFLDDPILSVVRRPLGEMAGMAGPMLRSALRRQGAPLGERLQSAGLILGLIRKAFRERGAMERDDPLRRARQALEAAGADLGDLEESVAREIEAVVARALAPAAGEGGGR
ncbi:MAG: thiamine pyrophosphate-dependent dehydrogenase E1 component subunit alpha [Anaerolineae bacterium]